MSIYKGMIVAIVGPSGVGKNSIIERLMKLLPEGLGHFSVSATTRPSRNNEVDGKNYFFWNLEQFLEAVYSGELIEFDKNGKNYYGTPKKQIETALESGKIVLMDINIIGAQSVRIISSKLGWKFIDIFIHPPSFSELESRLRSRASDSEEEILDRLARSSEELLQAKQFSHQDVNENLNDCVHRLHRKIMTAYTQQ